MSYALTRCYAISGTDIGDATTRKRSSVLEECDDGGISLHACYAMSSTDVAYGGIFLRAYSAMSGTDLAYEQGPRTGTGAVQRAKSSQVQSTPRRNQLQSAAISLHFVPCMQLLLFDFAVQLVISPAGLRAQK
eukprot:1966632-Rhodomonas_salina.1